MIKISVLLIWYCAAEGLAIVLVAVLRGKLPSNILVRKL